MDLNGPQSGKREARLKLLVWRSLFAVVAECVESQSMPRLGGSEVQAFTRELEAAAAAKERAAADGVVWPELEPDPDADDVGSPLLFAGIENGLVSDGAVCGGDDSSGEVVGFAASGLQGNDRKSPRLLLSEEQYRLEHLLAAAVASEFIRVAAPADSRVTARYASQVVDNSRLLSGGNARLHLNLLRSQVRWLKSLKPGELR